jgi:YHS domain-containing protein
MLFRWIIIFIIGLLVYRYLKRFLSAPKLPERNPPQEIQDEMVQDPVCKVYLPKRQAKVLNSTGGINYYFCSTQCREKFIEEAKDRSSA